MDFTQLNEKVGRLFRHFRLKQPDRETIGLWLDELGYIPNEAAEWIVRKTCSESEGLPRNVVKLFKDRWQAFKAEFPDKVRTPDPEFCQVCGESGLIWFEYQISGHPARHVSFVRCGHCDNHQLLNLPEDVPRMTAGDIVRNGGALHWRNNRRRKKGDMVRKHRRVDFGKLIQLQEASDANNKAFQGSMANQGRRTGSNPGRNRRHAHGVGSNPAVHEPVST